MATKKKLTDKQALFVKEYLIDLNATQAAIRAGYSKKTAKDIGCQNLAKLNIAEEIAEGANKRAERLDIDAQYVLNQSVKLHERCMQEVRPKMVKIGKEYVQAEDEYGQPIFLFDATGAAKALDMVGKHVNIQAFKENINLTKDMKDLDDEELQAIIDGRSK